MPYIFGYAVTDSESSSNFDHHESSDAQVITGSYRVALPDGRTQIVNYTADDINGYVADVKYEGEAQYPEHRKSHWIWNVRLFYFDDIYFLFNFVLFKNKSCIYVAKKLRKFLSVDKTFLSTYHSKLLPSILHWTFLLTLSYTSIRVNILPA